MMRAAALSMRCSGSVLRGALSVRTPHPWPRSLRRVHAAAATCDALGSSGEKKDLPPLPKEASVVVVGGGVIGASVGYHLRFAARLCTAPLRCWQRVSDPGLCPSAATCDAFVCTTVSLARPMWWYWSNPK